MVLETFQRWMHSSIGGLKRKAEGTGHPSPNLAEGDIVQRSLWVQHVKSLRYL